MVGFELGLGLLAILISWLFQHWPFVGMRWSAETLGEQFGAIAIGILAAIPIAVLVYIAFRFPVEPIRSVRELSERLIIPIFKGFSVTEIAAVSLAAAVGEELLFRGSIQAAINDHFAGGLGPVIALGVASIAFGLCHWLNPTYAALATCMGVYFGLLLHWTGSLWTPIFAHATYDFVALLYLLSSHGDRFGKDGQG
jgi:uncharacterized protein